MVSAAEDARAEDARAKTHPPKTLTPSNPPERFTPKKRRAPACRSALPPAGPSVRRSQAAAVSPAACAASSPTGASAFLFRDVDSLGRRLACQFAPRQAYRA